MGRPKKKVAKAASRRTTVKEAPKKRGRPRKEAEAPKKRGRPKKVETTEVKRRGRPKKELETAKPKSKQDLVTEATGKARSIAVSEADLNKAKDAMNRLDSSSRSQMKRVMQQVERKEWNKNTHLSINGKLEILLTEAVAQALDI